jgi:Uncharacterized conserved protein
MLLLVLTIKFFAIGLLFLEPGMRDTGSGTKGMLTMASSLFASGSAAEAATGEGAGAPPSLEMQTPGKGTGLPGVPSLRGESADGDPALPPIGVRPSTPAAAGNSLPAEFEALTRRQEDLARKEQELRVLEGELSKKLEQMQLLENRMAIMMKDAEGTQDAKFRHLVDVLSNMKAKQAASVLETLDSKIAVKVLAGMRGRQAGEILTFVKAEKAAQLTEALARMQLPLD